MERELIMHTFERLLAGDTPAACEIQHEGLAVGAALCVEVLQRLDSYAESN
jgi:hypothetical protein